MAFAGFSKSPIAAAASLFVALSASAAVAATPGFEVQETIVKKTDAATGKPTSTAQSKSLDPNGTATITVYVLRSGTDQPQAVELDFNFTLPAGVDFGSVSGCTLPDNFDPTKAQPSCTLGGATLPFPYDAKTNTFANKAKVTITVARHYDSKATTCATADLGNVTVLVSSKDVNGAQVDPPTAATTTPTIAWSPTSGPVTLGVNPYADIGVDATAPATANVGDTIKVVGTVTNNGPCPATNVQVDPETANAAGVTLLSFQSISGGCGSQTFAVDPKSTPPGVITTTPSPAGEEGSCVIPSLAVGQSATITKTYHVDSVGLKGQSQTMRTSGFSLFGGDQADPNGSNDVADTATMVPQDGGGGCSTGGAVGPMALLGLMLVLSRKRRTA